MHILVRSPFVTLDYRYFHVHMFLLFNFYSQRHVLKGKFSEWQWEDMEWFFNYKQGIIGFDGQPKSNSKAIMKMTKLMNNCILQ